MAAVSGRLMTRISGYLVVHRAGGYSASPATTASAYSRSRRSHGAGAFEGGVVDGWIGSGIEQRNVLGVLGVDPREEGIEHLLGGDAHSNADGRVQGRDPPSRTWMMKELSGKGPLPISSECMT